MTFRQFEVVKVPFPFTDRTAIKTRPALILSNEKLFNLKVGHSLLAMITSAKNSVWPLDINIIDLKIAGLPAASIVRMKLFTLDHRLIIDTLGKLSHQDVINVKNALNRLLN